MAALLVTVQAETIGDLREKFKLVAKEFGLDFVAAGQVENKDVTFLKAQPQGVDPAAEEKVKGKPGRKPAAKVEDVQPEVEETSVIETSAVKEEIKAATQEDALTALTALNGKKGLPVAREVLQKFGVSKFSLLQPADYGKFVAECLKVAA